MPIHKPDRVLLHHVPLKFVRSKVAGGGRKSMDSQIPLVPFIDFLITLVVFLLSSFSASGELLSQRPNLVMPNATNAIDLELAPIVAIDARVVTLDGRRMADTPTLAANAGLERIEQLVSDLETLRRNWSILHAREPFPGTVIVQADRSIDFRVIKKVMFSAAQAGYTNISFAVNQTGGD
ncbi:ExbD/TolR family protein [Sandaracinus amylolyticus]|uniref:ExbD/TolR family protein n=1 Tax=Sandaracinus amylolyticus TaxID=927083 RepID=UPI00069CF427|nr:biopolymer transporter ExbD [Sandaracinus amylolyticus]